MVSIIVPVYNVNAYLERCVKSILHQTVTDIEIILVDDGSTDGSEQQCDRFAEADDRICVIHKANGGLSSARNRGLQCAKGEFVCFVDSDDVISPYYVEHLLHLVQVHACDIAVGQYVCFNEDEPRFANGDEAAQILEGKKAIDKLFGATNVCATIACNKLYKKALFSDVKFPDGLIHEDEAVAYRLYYKADRVAFSDTVVYGYYRREDSISTSPFSKRKFDFLKIAWERCLFFKAHKEERYYHLFLKLYCWILLEYSKKTRKYLKDVDRSKMLLKEFKEKSKELLCSPYISKSKRIAIRVYRICTPFYYISTKVLNYWNKLAKH